MELSEFLLLFTTTHTLFTSDSGATHATHADAALCSLLSQAPWPPLFFVLCTAALATMTSTSTSAIPPHLWARLSSPVGVLTPLTDERHWLRRCRMSYAAFVYLVEELRPHLVVESVEPLEVEVAVAMVLNRLATGASPTAVGELWGAAPAAVIEYTNVVTSALASYSKLYSKYVVAPTGKRLERISKAFFEATGVLNMAGAIGGTRIASCSDDGLYSVFLQGVCDADKVFWDVCCGDAGRSSDEEHHLKCSGLWTRLCENEVLREPIVTVQDKPVRPFLVGNETYPLVPFLVKPYNGGQASTDAEMMFDAQLRKGHASIVSAFGILENRWRILKNLNVDRESASQTVVACCVLHNFCQLSNQSEPEVQVDDALNYSIREPRCEDGAGEETRRVLFLDWLARHRNPP